MRFLAGASLVAICACSGGGDASPDAAVDGASDAAAPNDATSSCEAGLTACGDACVDLSTDAKHCGACATVCDTTCCAGVCDGATIADHQSNVTKMRLDATSIYWGGPGYVAKIDKAGGLPTNLVTFPGTAADLVVDGGYVYFINPYGSSTDVVRVPTSGGAYAPIAQAFSQAAALTLDATHVYWSTYPQSPTNDLVFAPKIGGSAAPFGPIVSWTAYELASDGTYIFENDRAGIATIDIQSEKLTSFGYGGTKTQGMAVDSGTLFWRDCSGAICNVYSGPTTGTTTPKLVASENGSSDAAAQLAVNGAFVYWTDPYNDTVNKAPRAGGAVTTIAYGQKNARAIAADDSYVYWADDESSGEIHRACK